VHVAKITVLIEEGRVKEVDGIPVDMYVEVRNYDVDRLDKNGLSKDNNGRPCEIREWHAPE
jgi:hypothetical protein